MHRNLTWIPPTFLLALACNGQTTKAELDLSNAVVVVRPGNRPVAEAMSATILVDEVARRTGIRWPVETELSDDARSAIVITTRNGAAPWSSLVPKAEDEDSPEARAEGFAIRTRAPPARPKRVTVFVVGADPRGTMFGVGRLLRALLWANGKVTLPGPLDIATAPAFPIRGHQLGYRDKANSYDAWTPEQYEQYIRELIVFGANCIENIPFAGGRRGKHMPVPREQMNIELGRLCAAYDIDYWVWTPAPFSLQDEKRRTEELATYEAFYKATPRLDAVFFPGGDPGSNPVKLVMPYLRDIAALLAKHHPKAGVWISLQGFDRGQCEEFLKYVVDRKPTWLTGVVAGPSSPPIPVTRTKLPRQYKLRWYPDITHCVRSQFEVHYWDPAFAMTLGRECVAPRAYEYARIFRYWAPHTDGFLTYSDGIHDDVNKAVWSRLGWEPDADVRETLVQYARFFFAARTQREAEDVADAILGLENNFRGSIAENGSIDGVLALWRAIETARPELLADWRFQIHLMRAYYDAYIRARLLPETKLEEEAVSSLADAAEIGADAAMDRALAILKRADHRVRPDWHRRIHELAEASFKSIGFQTSVPRFGASGYERGAVLDFLDLPVNDRWWLEDQFAEIRKLSTQAEKLARLETIRSWEDPGPGSFYDDIGHVGKSPHVVRTEGRNTDPEMHRHDCFSHFWHDDGKTRMRRSWIHHMRWPAGIRYEAVDPRAEYVIRLTGNGDVKLRADGERLEPRTYAKKVGEFKEFAVPKALTADGVLLLTFDPIDESHLNWRQHSHVAEVWLLKQ